MADFSLTRSTTVDAPTDRVVSLLDDFHEWRAWSPWEDVDPDLERAYSGPERGVGARYGWSGNAKAGTGSMEIIECTPTRVSVDLRFEKPFKARNLTAFDLEQAGGGLTRVTWTMTGRRNPLMALAGKLFLDKAIGEDFEKGLARLKAAAESR